MTDAASGLQTLLTGILEDHKMGGQRAIPANNMIWQVLDSVENRRIGVLKSQQYQRKMCRLLGHQLRATESRRFENFARAEDADIRGDRLAVISTHHMAQYEVVHRTGDQDHEYACLLDQYINSSVPMRTDSRWMRELMRPVSMSCVRWSPAGAMLTTSGTVGDPNAVRVLDEATATTVETVDVVQHGSNGVLTHEHSVLDPALIGIGTTLSKVLISDLRTGNITVSSGTKHTSSINGIGWSLTDKHMLVTACSNETFVWDTRYFAKKPLLQLTRHTQGRLISPHIQFLDANRVLVMTDSRMLQVYNVNNGTIVDSIEVFYRPKRSSSRCKFALNREANTVFYAVKRSVRRYNLDTKKIEMEAKCGHVWPIQMILFNDYTKELYTMNDENEAIVWTPFR